MAMAAARGGAPEGRRQRCTGAPALLPGAHAATPAALADVIIPATGFVGLASGGIDAACSDPIITGTPDLILSQKFTVAPGGAFDAQSATVAYDTTRGPGAAPAQIPTLGNAILIAMSGLLAALATFCGSSDAPLCGKNTPRGAGP